jgi:molecular chaperone DnaK
MSKTIGIDFGTTTSSVAYHDGVSVRLFETPEGDRVMPSVVSILEDGRTLVGKSALNELAENGDFTYQHAKGLLGEIWNDNEDQGFQTIESINGWVAYVGPNGKNYLPEDLTALILGELKAMAEEGLGEIVTNAVITVPSDCSDAQREKTIKAGKLAGFEEVETLVEPMAAAMGYGFDLDDFQRLAVYDLGGGTFDIAFMDTKEGGAREIQSLGIDHLGGRDFDERIAEFVVDKFLAEHEHVLNGPIHGAKLTEIQFRSEEAKKTLSTNDIGRIRVTFVARDKDGQTLHLNHDLGIQEFESLCHDYIEQTIDACQRCLKLTGRDLAEVDEVLLVGGMTRVPAVRKAVEDFFGKVPVQKNPDTIVAEGAAVKAAQKDGRIDLNHENTASASYGIVNPDRSVRKLLPRGTKFGTSKSFKLTTDYDGQPVMRIVIVRGDEDLATYNDLVESISHPVEPGPQGKVTVPLTLTLTPEGLLETEVGN